VNSGEPFEHDAEAAAAIHGRGTSWKTRCSRNSSEPSLTRDRPGPKRPLKPICSNSLRISFRSSFTPRRTADWRAYSRSVCPTGHRRRGVAADDIGDVLPFDQHLGLADGIGLGVQFLPIHHQAGIGVEATKCSPATLSMPPVPAWDRRASAHAGLGERLVILDEQQIHHRRITSRGVKCSPAVSLDARRTCGSAPRTLRPSAHC